MKCPYCDKQPHEIEEYKIYAKLDNVTPEQFVIKEEGTYDHRTKLFCCTICYVTIGAPTNDRLHEAFRYYRQRVEPLEGLDKSYINQF